MCTPLTPQLEVLGRWRLNIIWNSAGKRKLCSLFKCMTIWVVWRIRISRCYIGWVPHHDEYTQANTNDHVARVMAGIGAPRAGNELSPGAWRWFGVVSELPRLEHLQSTVSKGTPVNPWFGALLVSVGCVKRRLKLVLYWSTIQHGSPRGPLIESCTAWNDHIHIVREMEGKPLPVLPHLQGSLVKHWQYDQLAVPRRSRIKNLANTETEEFGLIQKPPQYTEAYQKQIDWR